MWLNDRWPELGGVISVVDAKTFATGELLSSSDVNEYLNGNFWKRIDRQIVASGSPVSSVSFPSLSSTFRLFKLTVSIVSNSSTSSIGIRLNNDAGNNYDSERVSFAGTSASIDNVTGQSVAFSVFHQGPVVATGQVLIAKQATGVRAVSTSDFSLYATAYSPPQIKATISSSWNNTSVLINRIDWVTTVGNFYGVIALDGMRGA